MRRPRAALGRVGRSLRTARRLKRASAAHGASLPAVVRQAARLYRRHGFRPREASGLGLLDPRLPDSELGQHVSRRRLRPLQGALNPEAFLPLTEDKALFARVCEELGLPTPATLALLFDGGLGWARDGTILAGADDWVGFLAGALPAEVVVKPARGHFGLGVRLLTKTPGGFVEADGRRWTPRELYADLVTRRRYGTWMFQERVRNHPELVRLGGGDALQTLRMLTLAPRGGDARLLFAELKIVVGDGVVDNIRGGATGNLAARVDAEDGTLAAGIREAPDRFAREVFAVHPRTGRPIEGARVPFWEEARRLVLEAAGGFLPLRTLGFDVAVTPAGPLIVEANALWGPPNPLRAMRELVAALAAEAAGVPAPRTRRWRPPGPAVRLAAAPGRALSATRFARRAAASYGVRSTALLQRARRLKREKGLGLRDAALFGLLAAGAGPDDEARYLGRAELRPLQDRLNPATFSPLTEDKAVFYRYAAAIGLPVPRPFAFFFRGSVGWTPDGDAPASPKEWTRFLADSLPDEFVLKPARGHRGVAVGTYRRDGDGFADHSGRRLDASALYESLASHPRFPDWIFQERLANHPDLVRMSGTDALQCARMITLVDGEGSGRLLFAFFRAIGGEAIFDNFRDGRAGNFRVRIAREDGTLLPGVAHGAEDLGLVAPAAHPRTGLPFADFKLPHWAEARALVTGAAPRFLPVRTIGWDVAFTERGPVVVEGNMWWAPPNELAAMPGIMEAVRADEHAGRLLAARPGDERRPPRR